MDEIFDEIHQYKCGNRLVMPTVDELAKELKIAYKRIDELEEEVMELNVQIAHILC